MMKQVAKGIFYLTVLFISVECYDDHNGRNWQWFPQLAIISEINSLCGNGIGCHGVLRCTPAGDGHSYCRCPTWSPVYDGHGRCSKPIAFVPPPPAPAQAPAPSPARPVSQPKHEMGGECEINRDCMGDLRCYSRVCLCQSDSVYIGDGICFTAPPPPDNELGKYCSNNAGCLGDLNCINGRCQCSAGYYVGQGDCTHASGNQPVYTVSSATSNSFSALVSIAVLLKALI